MKKILAVALALLMALSIVGCDTTQPAPSTPSTPSTTTPSAPSTPSPTPAAPESKYDQMDKIIIGCVTSLTGERAQNGAYTKEALDMWLEETNSAGGLLGKKVEIVYEDDQSTDQGGANAYQKLMSRGDICSVTSPLYSSIVLAMEPYIAQYKIPTFTGGSSARMAEIGNPYLWQIRYNDTMAGATMGKAAVDILGMKKPAIIHESDSFGQGLADASRTVLVSLGLSDADILDITYNKGEKNFAPFIAKIKEAGCDGILAVSQQIEASLIMMQVQSSGLDLPCIGSTSYCSEIAINNAQGAAENWYSVSDWSPTVTTSPTKEWIDRYNEKYGHVPDLPSSCNWDSVMMLAKAIEDAGSADPEKINEALGNIKGLQCMASVCTPNEDRICATTQFLTKNIGGKAVIQDVVAR